MSTLIKEIDKIDRAVTNFKKIKISGNTKFEKIDDWLEKESNLYLGEIKKNKERRYYHFKRGTLIKVDFGINPGSELCHTHFAIVLNKDDNTKKDTITVVPLTSKPGVGRLPLNNIINDEILKSIKKKYNSLNINDDTGKILELINFYKKYDKFSYAVISQITTISKSRIIFSDNEYDILNKARCSREILEDIDKAVLKTLTGIKLNEIQQDVETRL